MRFAEILELFSEAASRLDSWTANREESVGNPASREQSVGNGDGALRTGPTDENRFWADIARLGTPVVDSCAADASLRDVTFLFRAADSDVRSVRLVANRVTDKHRKAAGIMARVPGTGIWGVTLSLPADLRVSYGFSPSASEAPEPMSTGRRAGPPVLLAPFNLDPPLRRSDPSAPERGTSVYSGPYSPDHSPWLADAPLQGSNTVSTRCIAGFDCPVHIYAPPTRHPEALLVLFDGDDWFEGMGVARACEAAGLPPLVIVGIGAADRKQRIASLSAHRGFLGAITTELLPQIETELSRRGYVLPDRRGRIVSGQSLGGLSSLVMALDTPETFGTVLAHSSSLWWRPGGSASPADLGRSSDDDWLTSQVIASEGLDVAFRLAVGSREDRMVDHHHRLLEALTEKVGAASLSVYEGGHDYACWRGALIDGLSDTLGTVRDAGDSGSAQV